MKKLLFKKNESYKHKNAIQVLKSWFEPEYICIPEQKFFVGSDLLFVPDLTLTQEGTTRAIYEVVHKHGLTGKKLGLIQYWCSLNYDFPVYEVNADWILDQTGKPDIIQADKFYTDTLITV
jgi:hypothetical protein